MYARFRSTETARTPARSLPVAETIQPRRNIASAALRTLFAGVLAIALSSTPTTALAWRSPNDQVGGTPLSSGRVEANVAPDVDAAAGILITEDGRALWSRAGDARRAMASTTKIMTGLLAVEHGKLEYMASVSKSASRVPYATGLHAGERIRAQRLLELALVASSNDAAQALGEHVAGDNAAFVRLMNERAAELGLKNTRFANAHGLDAPGHYSSPSDLAKLAREAMKHGEFRRVVTMRKVQLPKHYPRPARDLKSTDKLLGVYAGIKGVKTGFTRNAGYSFVASATRNGTTLTAVVLGAAGGTARFTQAARLMDWGFKNLSTRELAKAGETVAEVPLAANPGLTVPVRLTEGASARIFAPDGPVTREPSLTANVALPVLEGQPVGEVRVMQGKRELARIPAVAATSTISAEETVGAVPVTDYVNRTVTVRAAEVTQAPPPEFDPKTPVEQRIDLKPRIAAPVAEGEPMGEITYVQGDLVVARVPVVAAESIQAPDFVSSIRTAFARAWRSLLGGPTMAQLQVVGA